MTLLFRNAVCLKKKNSKDQIYRFWFQPTGTRTHDLPHSEEAHEKLHHRFEIFMSCLSLQMLVRND